MKRTTIEIDLEVRDRLKEIADKEAMKFKVLTTSVVNWFIGEYEKSPEEAMQIIRDIAKKAA